jgi:MGT family glycosyltransferase
MAKALFFNVPAYGHINPTLPLVKELTGRGETVVYYAMKEFQERIEAAGAQFRDYEKTSEGAGFDFGTASDPRSFNLIKLARVLIEFTDRNLTPLLAAASQFEPDYIIHDFSCIWGKYIAEILELPAIATFPQFPVNMKRRPDPYPGYLSDTIRMLLTGLPSLIKFQRSAKKISNRYPVRKTNFFTVLANHEALNIVFTSRSFQPHESDFDDSFLFVGPSIVEREESLDFSLDFGNGPLVYISLGTIFSTNIPFYQHCFEAFGDMDCRVIVSAGKRTDINSIGESPGNFVVRNTVPQLEILKNADVFVTHGGMNSVSEGLLFEVPLVVVPQAADQYFVAQRVNALNAGIVLDSRYLSPEKLREAVDKVIVDPTLSANAKAIGQSFREAGGYVKAADKILRFTRGVGQ